MLLTFIHRTVIIQNAQVLFATHHHLLFLEFLLRDLLLVLSVSRRLRDRLFLLGENDFYVTRAAHVRIDSTVSAVGASTHLWRTIHLNVLNDKMIRVQTLKLRIALGVLEHLKQKFGALFRPTTLRCSPMLGLRASSYTAGKSSEWHTLFVRNDVLKKCNSATQVHTFQRHGRLACILEMNS